MNGENHTYTNFRQQLEALQQEYDELLPRHLREIEAFIGQIDTGETSPALLVSLHHAIHRLAGSGATYGYPELSTIARDMEHLVKAWIEPSSIPLPSQADEMIAFAGCLRKAANAGRAHSSPRPATRREPGTDGTP